MNIQHQNGKIQNKKMKGNGMIMMKMILVMQVNKIGEEMYLKDKEKNLKQKITINVKDKL